MNRTSLIDRVSLSQFCDRKCQCNERLYLVKEKPSTKEERIIKLADYLKKEIIARVGIKVKFPLGSREKRLEIVALYKNTIFIIKLSSEKSFDVDAFELDEIISNFLRSENSRSVIGILYIDDMKDTGNLSIIEENLSNKIIIVFNEKDTKSKVVKHGLSN